MIELLILYILYAQKTTQYGIRKIIKDKFSYLTSSSFGTIHPAIMRLLAKGFITEKKTVSDGGRRKNIYSITEEGKLYIEAALKADFPLNTPNLEKMINTKLACSDVLDEAYQKTLYVKVVRYYEQQILILKRTLKQAEYNELQSSQVKSLITFFESKINWLEDFI